MRLPLDAVRIPIRIREGKKEPAIPAGVSFISTLRRKDEEKEKKRTMRSKMTSLPLGEIYTRQKKERGKGAALAEMLFNATREGGRGGR